MKCCDIQASVATQLTQMTSAQDEAKQLFEKFQKKIPNLAEKQEVKELYAFFGSPGGAGTVKKARCLSCNKQIGDEAQSKPLGAPAAPVSNRTIVPDILFNGGTKSRGFDRDRKPPRTAVLERHSSQSGTERQNNMPQSPQPQQPPEQRPRTTPNMGRSPRQAIPVPSVPSSPGVLPAGRALQSDLETADRFGSELSEWGIDARSPKHSMIEECSLEQSAEEMRAESLESPAQMLHLPPVASAEYGGSHDNEPASPHPVVELGVPGSHVTHSAFQVRNTSRRHTVAPSAHQEEQRMRDSTQGKERLARDALNNIVAQHASPTQLKTLATPRLM